MKKTTLATLKSFIRKNSDNLFINIHSRFSGMIDGTEIVNSGFFPAKKTERNVENTLGFEGIWIVGQSRDYIKPFSENGFVGFEVSNSCRNYYVAIKA